MGLFACISKSCQVQTRHRLDFGLGMMLRHQSSQKGAWPTGATSFAEAKQDDYGVYLDVKLSSAPKKLSFLINNAAGTNLSGDKASKFLALK